MLSKFIITGLPRSRTGWLSNLFTYGSSFCLHDGLAGGNDFFMRLLSIAASNPNIRHVGNSDSGIPLFLPPEEFNDCKVLVVLRGVKAAKESFLKYFSRHPYPQLSREMLYPRHIHKFFDRAGEMLKRFYTEIPISHRLLIAYEDLDNVEMVGRAWHFLVPDEPFNVERFRQLSKLRINPASEKVRWESNDKPLTD